MALFDFVTNLLSGGKSAGLEKMLGGLGKAQTRESDFLDYLKGQYQPYLSAGQTALGEYLPAIEEMRDPQQFYQQMMGGYETSPQAQRAMEEGIRAATQGAAAAGGLGGGELLKNLQERGQQLTAEDQQRWLNTMMGIRGGYTGGLENLIGGGRQALSSFAPTGTAITGDIADLLAQQGMGRGALSQARYQPWTDWLGKGMSMVGGAATGGLGGGAGSLMGLGF